MANKLETLVAIAQKLKKDKIYVSLTANQSHVGVGIRCSDAELTDGVGLLDLQVSNLIIREAINLNLEPIMQSIKKLACSQAMDVLGYELDGLDNKKQSYIKQLECVSELYSRLSERP